MKPSSGLLLDAWIERSMGKFLRDVERDMLITPAVYAFAEKVKRDKWRLVVVLDSKRILETSRTWRTKREALPFIEVVRDAARAVRGAYVKDAPNPFAGLEQLTYSTPISYMAKDKR